MVAKRLIFAIGVLLVLSIAASLLNAQQPIPLPQPGARATTELLLNSSFEDDTNGDKIPDGWTAQNTTTKLADKQKCNKTSKWVAHSGNCAFQFKGNADGSSSAIAQSVETSVLTDGAVLTFSAYLDPRSGIAGSVFGRAQIKFSDGTKLKLVLAIPDTDTRAPADYTLVETVATLVIPSGASISSAKVKFGYNRTTGKFLIDDVRLAVSVPDATSTPTPNTTTTSSLTPTASVTPTLNATATSSLTPTATLTATSTPLPLPTKLLASDGAGNDRFGAAVAYSRSADTLLIGAYGVNDNQGAAYVFVRSGTAWVQQATLIASDGAALDNFGYTVALSADGNTALVGAVLENVGTPNDQDAAYIFVRSGTTWTQQAKLLASDGTEYDRFGWSVALSADGNTALVGAYYDDVGANEFQGSAYIFVRSGTTWTEQAKLIASDGAAFDLFGSSVSLSADGNTALVGADNAYVGANANQGMAYAFTRSGTAWTQQAKLIADDGTEYDRFGWSVALSSDGNTALVSARNDEVGANVNQGTAYTFTRSGSAWTQQAQLIASDGAADDWFGWSVALSSDGNTALVGAVSDDVGANQSQGSAYTFTRSGMAWTQQTQLFASDGAADDSFGSSVALSGDGLVALVGAPGDDISATTNQGSAYIFVLP